MSAGRFSRFNRRALYLAALLLAGGGLALAALILPFSRPLSAEPLKVGSVAPQDIQAPYVLTYKSEVLTEAQREKAASEVAPIYSPADTSVARRQLERLRAALSYITSVRADIYASQDQQVADLEALKYVRLDPDTTLSILLLNNSRWEAVQSEAMAVLEQVMRTTIREDKLEDARRGVPSLISLSLAEDQANIVAVLVEGFIAPNSLYNKNLTEAARQQARANVQPVTRAFVTGETIVQRGTVITANDLETLAMFDLLQPSYRSEDVISAGALVLLVLAFQGIYSLRNPGLIKGSRGLRALTLIGALFLAFLFSARLLIPGHTVLPYLFPMAAYSLTISVLFGAELALVSTLPLAIMITYGLPFSLELSLYYALSSFFGVLTLGRAKRINAFFWAAIVVAAAGIAVVIAYRVPQPSTDWVGIATLTGAAIVNGVASASITLILQFFLAQLLDMTTAMQLMELSRPDHPLLQLLLHAAPGTYQHSLQVANLAEQAAERIGADAMLTRVGALYHDAGKAVDAIFFIENQLPGEENPHDDLDPAFSAAMIIRHVTQGVELARKYRLPRPIQDFIIEHHGNMIARYQFCRAIEAAGGDESKVDKDQFRYPGPRPQSRETALLMLADGCEALVRAEHPKDEDELREVIRTVIDNRVGIGALNDTPLTLKDLERIEDSFVATLRGVYHPRIQYPKMEVLPSPQEGLLPNDRLLPKTVDQAGDAAHPIPPA